MIIFRELLKKQAQHENEVAVMEQKHNDALKALQEQVAEQAKEIQRLKRHGNDTPKSGLFMFFLDTYDSLFFF